jgi:hypothetical protein
VKVLPIAPKGYSEADQVNLRRSVAEELSQAVKKNEKYYSVGLYIKDSTGAFLELTSTASRPAFNGNALAFQSEIASTPFEDAFAANTTLVDTPSDGVPFKWGFGPDADTSYPAFQIGGFSRGGIVSRIYMARDAGDSVDYGAHSVDGDADAPTNWPGFCPHVTYYSWSPQVDQPSRPLATTTYLGRHFQMYGGQIETPADGALGGFWAAGATKTGQITPWLNMWLTGDGAGRGLVLAGRSNVPDEEARASDGGSIITGTYHFGGSSTRENIFSAGGINPKDTDAKGNLHIMCSDDATNFAAIAFRFNDAWTYGFDLVGEFTSDALVWYPVAAGTRGSNGVTYTADGDISLGATRGYQIAGTKVVGAQGAAVSDALTGGSATAADVATQLNLVLARLRAHGLIAT